MCTRSTNAAARSGSPACAGSTPVGTLTANLPSCSDCCFDHLFVLVEEREQRGVLGLVRLARQQDLVEPIEPRRVVAAGFADAPGPPAPATIRTRVAVVERQRLQRRRRHVALAVHLLRRGHVERLEHRIGDAAPREDIEAAAVVVLRSPSTCSRDCRRSVAGHRREDAGAADRRVEQAAAASSESRICSASRRWRGNAPSSLLSGSAANASSRWCRRLPVDARQQNLAVQRFHAPAARDELLGEIVEQLGVRRCCAGVAEVADRWHDAAAEVLRPDAVRRTRARSADSSGS